MQGDVVVSQAVQKMFSPQQIGCMVRAAIKFVERYWPEDFLRASVNLVLQNDWQVGILVLGSPAGFMVSIDTLKEVQCYTETATQDLLDAGVDFWQCGMLVNTKREQSWRLRRQFRRLHRQQYLKAYVYIN